MVAMWRRLDADGHDACVVRPRNGGWELRGTAIFTEDGRPAVVHYRVTYDSHHRTERGRVHGWWDGEPFRFCIRTHPWSVNGVAIPGLDDCLDLDYGFTPATNRAQLLRLNLQPGEAADAPAAWFNLPDGTLQRLQQRYERRDVHIYYYEAPAVSYSGLLEVTSDSFVRDYPGLWLLTGG